MDEKTENPIPTDLTNDGPNVNEPFLNEQEIQTLLAGDDERRGWRLLIDPHSVSHERLPMLDVVFDRLIQSMTASLRQLTGETVDVTLRSMSSARLGDYLAKTPIPTLINVIKADPWDGQALIVVESNLAYDVIDLLLGGRRAESGDKRTDRPFTTIERQLVERLVGLILVDLGKAFLPVSNVTFRLDRLETNPKFAAIIRPIHGVVLAQLDVEMDCRGGKIDILIPYSTLEPIRESLLQTFMGEKFGQDTIWESHLEGQLWETDVTLDAILDQITVNLRDTLAWKIGSRLMLNAKPDTSITLKTGEIPALIGKMGQKDGKIAIQIEHNYIVENKIMETKKT